MAEICRLKPGSYGFCYPIFAEIIERSDIEEYIKISAIERNTDAMTEWISDAESAEDISAVISAMYIHPLAEIGDALKAAAESGKLKSCAETEHVIEYIEKNGITLEKEE